MLKISKLSLICRSKARRTRGFEFGAGRFIVSNFVKRFVAAMDKKRKPKPSVAVNIEECKYPILTACIREQKWKTTESENEPWTLRWSDKSVTPKRVLALHPHQFINHFPGMQALSRKAQLAHYLKRMQLIFPNAFEFVPQCWVLPREWAGFDRTLKQQKSRNRTYIVKPDHSSQGKGIFLTRTVRSINRELPQVIQRYIAHPFLLDGYKFDLRLYVLVRSIDPLYIYIYKDGLLRLCTEKYVKPVESNLHATTMHLTNYAVNKRSPDFVPNANADENGVGNKRSLAWFLEWLKENEYDEDTVWENIKDVVVKTILSAQPHIAQTYNSCTTSTSGRRSQCFEVLGFDIMLDKKLNPWLIEVNHSPSFRASSPLDAQIKRGVVSNTLRLLNITAKDQKHCQRVKQTEAQRRLYGRRDEGSQNQSVEHELERAEAKHLGNFERIYPTQGPMRELYEELLHCSKQLHVQNAGSMTSIKATRKHKVLSTQPPTSSHTNWTRLRHHTFK